MAKYKAKVNTKVVDEKKVSKKVNKVEKMQKQIKNTKILTEEQEQVKKFIITLIVVIVIVVGLILLSTLIVDKRDSANNTTNNTTNEVEISYDVATVGMILNRPYNNYYVMVYDSTDNKAMYYSALITNYSSKDDALKIYFTDLNDGINKKYKSSTEEGNSNVSNDVNEFSFGNVTLLEISNGYVVNYYEGIENIESILK